jgi:lipid biosynthesis B12-binding/radical SAM protein
MKILLISSNIAQSPYPVYPLGLGMIAQVLRRAGHQAQVFDFLASDRSLAALAAKAKDFAPDMIGVSVRNIDNVNLLHEQKYIGVVKDIVDTLRANSSAAIVLGGAGFSIMPEAILDKVGADYGVAGEGEELVLEIASAIACGGKPASRIMRAPLKLESGRIPSAYYDPGLMDFYLKSGNMASVQTKRGCVHACTYCTYPLLEGHVLRCREPSAVVDDIERLLKEYKVQLIFFTDSVFNDDAGHYLDICRLMEKRGLTVPWTAFFKPQGMDEAGVRLMKATGLGAAELGSDAPTDTALRGLNKTFHFKDIRQANELLAAQGIATANYFMFGSPGETKAAVLEGIENIKSLDKTVSFIFMGIRILPGTGLYQRALADKLVAASDDLLEPVYYISPALDKKWLEETLTEAFKGIRHCVFPPDALESSLQFMHKLGYSGLLWEMLIPGNQKRNRTKKPMTNDKFPNDKTF